MQLGIKIWSINFDLIKEAKKIEDRIDFLEVYFVPKTPKKNISELKKINIPIIVHAPIELHGFNLADKNNNTQNNLILKKVINFSNQLKSKKIIFHPGSGGDIENVISMLKNIKNKEIFIENLTKEGINGEKMIGFLPENIARIKKELNCELCLDLSHAIKAAFSLKKDYKKFIKELLKLKPILFHLTGGNSNVEIDEHLNLWDGDFDLNFLKKTIKENNAQVTFETPKKNLKTLSQDLKNIDFFRKI
ncbi:MAG: TIM barrel protein [Nanoarchaeota archaeon]|nr:TIM barrel protein [Nanoarchaeota archaeon]MBU1029966.1 TIM barrel protein [Nanoarchaeota archaeon]MBU1849263.1 TIM barrel protein [Nanoarchaeota archaeon]